LYKLDLRHHGLSRTLTFKSSSVELYGHGIPEASWEEHENRTCRVAGHPEPVLRFFSPYAMFQIWT
jgi:hypothetical protein